MRENMRWNILWLCVLLAIVILTVNNYAAPGNVTPRLAQLLKDPRAVTVEKWKKLSEPEQKYLHYYRNKFQENKGIPQKESDLNPKEWVRIGPAAAHNMGMYEFTTKRMDTPAGVVEVEMVTFPKDKANIDYRGIGAREGQQAIYDYNGNLVTTDENMGTYDFAQPSYQKLEKEVYDYFGGYGIAFSELKAATKAIGQYITKPATTRPRSVENKYLSGLSAFRNKLDNCKLENKVMERLISATEKTRNNYGEKAKLAMIKFIVTFFRKNHKNFNENSLIKIVRDNNFKKHFIIDVNPWIKWGNTPKDPTRPLERIEALCSSPAGAIGYLLYREE